MAPTLALYTIGLYIIVLVIARSEAWMPDPEAKIKLGPSNNISMNRFLGNESARDIFRLLSKDDTSILIGGRNVIYNLSLDSLKEHKQERIEWKSSEPHWELCVLKGKDPDKDCQNYIRIAMKAEDGKLLVCGTNSYKPYCRHYHPGTHKGRFERYEQFDCPGVCSHDPEHNSTAIYTNGQLFSATTADFTGTDSLIYRSPQRTEHSDFNQLNNPSFISSYRYDDFVFFFFRETANEYMNCGKAVYSRVARVCVNDRGGPRQFAERFTSYLKARLNCSIHGDYPFYFNEIQSTSEIIHGSYGDGDRRGDVIYGVFTTPVNSIGGSAVCAFKMKDVLDTFNAGFKAQESINANWLPVEEDKIPKITPGKCIENSTNLSDAAVNFIKTHSLMERAVPSFLAKPLLIKANFFYRFTSIAVHPQVLALNQKRYDIIYVGTDNGTVIKTFNAASDSGDFDDTRDENHRMPVKTVVVSEVQMLPVGTPVKQLRISTHMTEKRLVAISDEMIVNMPLDHCDIIRNDCSRCMSIQDPHCAWDNIKKSCVWIGDGISPNAKGYYQDLEHGNTDICISYQAKRDDDLMDNHGRLSGVSNTPIEEDNRVDINPPSVVIVAAQDVHYKEKHETGPFKTTQADMIYTAQALHIAVVASCLVTLLIGFVVGYLFSRRFRHPFFSETAPFHEQHNHLNRLTPLETPLNANSTAYLPPRANKTINMVVNVPVKQDNIQLELGGKDRTHECKNSNESLDKDIKCGTLQKVKKTYI